MPCKYKCLRCGHIWASTYIKNVMEELSCPECDSNSQWRLKDKKTGSQPGPCPPRESGQG
jgi:DNA-directed RNA polymerase subunit RPC12/RpoP